MEDHHKMIGAGVAGIVGWFIHTIDLISQIAGYISAIGGAFLVIMGIIKWWKSGKDK
jgi:hypothetical protein